MEIDIFSYGGSFISPPLKECYDYKLKTNQRLQKRSVLIVEYVEKKLLKRSGCPVLEPNSGRAFVDPETMQIVRMEQTRREHPVARMLAATALGNLYENHAQAWDLEVDHPQAEGEATGTWIWAVDYAPVELDGKTFWLPKTISSKTKTNHPPNVTWTFVANYRNYHLLTVKSKLLPGYSILP